MKAFTFAITKTIVVTVEAEDGPAAVKTLEQDLYEEEYGHSWHRALSKLELLDMEELT